MKFEFNKDEKLNKVKTIVFEKLQFFRVILLVHKGVTVAAGSLMIIQERICDDDERHANHVDDLHDEEFRGIVQFMMAD